MKMYRSHKITVEVPASFFNVVQGYYPANLPEKTFGPTVDKTKAVLEESKYIKKARGKVMMTENGGYQIIFNVRTQYPYNVTHTLTDQAVKRILTNQMKEFMEEYTQ